jgi:hypothetical protein
VLFFCIKKRNAKKNAAPAVVANGGNVTSPMQQQQQQMASPYQGYDAKNQQGFQNQNGYNQYPQEHNAQQYGYFGGAAAVGAHGNLTKDAKLGVYDSVNSVPVSPVPPYNASQSPQPQGLGPSPVMENADVSGPRAGYHEAPGAPVQQNGYTPSPQFGVAQLVNVPPHQTNTPVELSGASREVPAAGFAPQQPNAPVELGTNPVAPRHNPQGNQVYEMGS